MKTYKLFKTDLVISTPYGRRCVWYAPNLDLCFVHYIPKKSNHSYAVGGWTQVDCGDHNWTKLKETVHTVEWDGPEMTSLALKDPILQQGFEIICKNLAELEKEKTDLVQEKNNLEYKIENLENKVEHHQEVIDTLQKK